MSKFIEQGTLPGAAPSPWATAEDLGRLLAGMTPAELRDYVLAGFSERFGAVAREYGIKPEALRLLR
jgi:hypothetical protein